jgi:hypothetical protein
VQLPGKDYSRFSFNKKRGDDLFFDSDEKGQAGDPSTYYASYMNATK